MRSFWTEPYLWIHLAGIAVLPLSLMICLLGLAAGDPILPPVVELGLVAIAGIAPIAWMQIQQPFCIFSLLAVAVRPERLS
ncbi:MAG TPA: low-complexity tail membrane protein, partial [Leptolyngbya sp.]|nr:low-complexity tail membrane protein [Leptolyngbya sp.]